VSLVDSMRNRRWRSLAAWIARYGPLPIAAFLLVAVWQDWISWQDSGLLISAVVAGSLYLRFQGENNPTDADDTKDS
jgi:hypothetical protein